MPIAHIITTGEAVVLSREDRLRHIWLLGKTGVGKSTLMRTMALADIEAGNGVSYIDPHAQDFVALMDAIPPSRVEDVVLYDPTDRDPAKPKASFSHNPLTEIPAEQIPVTAAMMAEGIRDIWHDAYSERMHAQVLHGLITLMEKRLTTFADLPLLFYKFPRPNEKKDKDRVTDHDWEIQRLRLRQRWLLSNIQSEPTRHFWKYEFPKYPADAPVAILSRIGQLLSSPHCSRVLNHETSAFSLKEAIDRSRVVLMNLPKGVLGNTGAALLGSFYISELRREIMARAALTPKQLEAAPDHYFYIDEFHTFATLSLTQLMSESRKYKLGLVLANQFTGQLDEKVLAAIKGNVGTMISFRVGDDDAEDLIGEFTPYNNDSLTDQLTAHAILKHGIKARPIITTPFAPQHSGSTKAVLHHSRRKYCRA
jgi:energy-coupling factor transporter ATP-binding protein EcfA2